MSTEAKSSALVPADALGTPLIDVSSLAPGAEVLVKDETRYASGSHKEPAARTVVARALADGFRRIVIGSCGNYGRAMAAACRDTDLGCTVVMPDGWSDGGAFMRGAGATVRLIRGSYEDAVAEARRLAEVEEDAVDGNVDGPYIDEVFAGLGFVVDAVHEALDEAPGHLWVPLGNGTTAIAVCRRSRELSGGSIVNGVGSTGNNPIVTSWPGPYEVLSPEGLDPTHLNEPLVNWDALHGAETMTALAESGGAASGVTDDELVAARSALEPFGVYPSAAGAVALAGLLGHSRRGGLAPGRHVVVLSGR